jgi:hypothetical protein
VNQAANNFTIGFFYGNTILGMFSQSEVREFKDNGPGHPILDDQALLAETRKEKTAPASI